MPNKANYQKNKEKHKAQVKDYCLRNPDQVKKWRNGRAKRNRDLLQSIKSGTACTDCGIQYPHYIMEFDHTGDKLCNVARMTSMATGKMLLEVAKCEVVCANCHNARTYFRRMANGD